VALSTELHNFDFMTSRERPRLKPNREKLPSGRMILYLLIALFLLFIILLWDRLFGFILL
jgi:hypothetical protein